MKVSEFTGEEGNGDFFSIVGVRQNLPEPFRPDHRQLTRPGSLGAARRPFLVRLRCVSRSVRNERSAFRWFPWLLLAENDWGENDWAGVSYYRTARTIKRYR